MDPHQQKDHFLPLKVIKDRLDEAGPGQLPADGDKVPVAEPEPAKPSRPPQLQVRSREERSRREAGEGVEAPVGRGAGAACPRAVGATDGDRHADAAAR